MLYHLPAEFLSQWMVPEVPRCQATGKRSRSTALGAQGRLGGQGHEHWASNSTAGVCPQETTPSTRSALPDTGSHVPREDVLGRCAHTQGDLLKGDPGVARVSLEREPSKGSHTRRPRVARPCPSGAFRGRRCAAQQHRDPWAWPGAPRTAEPGHQGGVLSTPTRPLRTQGAWGEPTPTLSLADDTSAGGTAQAHCPRGLAGMGTGPSSSMLTGTLTFRPEFLPRWMRALSGSAPC